MSEWLGLNWADIANIVVLALLPGLFAAYGGHLAAEAIQDQKRQRKVKGIFWLMFAIFVLVTGWQQIRVAESDLSRDTKDVLSGFSCAKRTTAKTSRLQRLRI